MAKVEDVEMAKKKEDEPNGPYSDLQPPTEYQPINWKKIFLTPKYIRMFVLTTTAATTLLFAISNDLLPPLKTRAPLGPFCKRLIRLHHFIAWHILMIVIAVITVLITIYHDKVVEVRIYTLWAYALSPPIQACL